MQKKYKEIIYLKKFSGLDKHFKKSSKLGSKRSTENKPTQLSGFLYYCKKNNYENKIILIHSWCI